MGRIKVGISSWTEPTLIKSGWYPPDATTAEDRLRYYASKFPVVEVDSTFYAIPNEKTAQLWVARTPKDFTFNAKAYALLTQHPTPAARLPKDLREKVSDSKANLYFKDLGPKEKETVWDRFREGLQPLKDAGKLGAIVFQFPKWFLPSPSAYRFMEDLREWLPDFGIAIEFRQALWMKDSRRQRVTEFLKDHHYTYAWSTSRRASPPACRRWSPSPRPSAWSAFMATTARTGRRKASVPRRSFAISISRAS
jgi:uncharacterized protein YecE (DUF72 family)